jgi:hypothetical protein
MRRVVQNFFPKQRAQLNTRSAIFQGREGISHPQPFYHGTSKRMVNEDSQSTCKVAGPTCLVPYACSQPLVATRAVCGSAPASRAHVPFVATKQHRNTPCAVTSTRSNVSGRHSPTRPPTRLVSPRIRAATAPAASLGVRSHVHTRTWGARQREMGGGVVKNCQGRIR